MLTGPQNREHTSDRVEDISQKLSRVENRRTTSFDKSKKVQQLERINKDWFVFPCVPEYETESVPPPVFPGQLFCGPHVFLSISGK